MALTKKQAIEYESSPNSLSNQQALVKRIISSEPRTSVKRVIPAGSSIIEDIGEKALVSAVYTWLRHCAHFIQATISFAKDPSTINCSRSKMVDFQTNGRYSEWEQRGKRWLAERVADIITRDNVVSVDIERDGIYLNTDKSGSFDPTHADWEPYIEFSPFRPPQF
jgi:hypothetical protein